MKPVLLATDGSPTAEEATVTAIELADKLGTELVVVTVWQIPYSTLGYAPIPMNDEISKVGEGQAEEVAGAAVRRAGEAGVEARKHVVRGFPVEKICLAAEELDPQLLVIGSHGWGAVKRMLFGSVSTGVLHHATCPVLVVRGDRVEPDATDGRLHDEVPA